VRFESASRVDLSSKAPFDIDFGLLPDTTKNAKKA